MEKNGLVFTTREYILILSLAAIPSLHMVIFPPQTPSECWDDRHALPEGLHGGGVFYLFCCCFEMGFASTTWPWTRNSSLASCVLELKVCTIMLRSLGHFWVCFISYWKWNQDILYFPYDNFISVSKLTKNFLLVNGRSDLWSPLAGT